MNLERVFIWNVKYNQQCIDTNERSIILRSISQYALIKFMRNAPQSLEWFRSNVMLQIERPTIEFLN